MLADTSVWIDHLHKDVPALRALLEEGQVFTHPHVIGELACGGLRNRTEVLSLLSALPFVTTADDKEVLSFIESHGLHGRGLGWVDLHLLASCTLSDVRLFTSDKRLQATAQSMNISFPSS